MLRKAAETDVHAAGFGIKIGGLRPSDTSQGFFDKLREPRRASRKYYRIASSITDAIFCRTTKAASPS